MAAVGRRTSLLALATCASLSALSMPALAGTAALMIVDMQPQVSERDGNHEIPANKTKLEQLLQRQRELIRLAKKRGVPILLVELKGCGATCRAITAEIGDYPNVRTFVKETPGVFEPWSGIAKEVTAHLNSLEVTDLIVAGANGGYCVKCSIDGALEEGFKVWTDPHAIADFDFTDFIYPYHYRDGRLSGRPGLAEKIHQRPQLGSFDEILGAEQTPAPSPPVREHCLKGIFGLFKRRPL